MFRRFLKLIGNTIEGRSPKWRALRNEWIKAHPTCESCGGKDYLEVHHKKPFNLFPQFELDPTNLMTLCEKPSMNCHLWIGHCGNFKSYAPDVVWAAKSFLDRLRHRPDPPYPL